LDRLAEDGAMVGTFHPTGPYVELPSTDERTVVLSVNGPLVLIEYAGESELLSLSELQIALGGTESE